MYHVIINSGGKEAVRQFPTEPEAFTVASQALQLKAANPELTVKVRVDYGDGHLYVPNEKEQVLSKGEPVLLVSGKLRRKAEVMPKKVGHIFCTECGFYTKLVDLDYAKGCKECGMSVNDFDIKTANGLWERVS